MKTPDLYAPDRRSWTHKSGGKVSQLFSPIRSAILRGLTVILPPLVTIVVVIWIVQLITFYVFEPMRGLARELVLWAIQDIKSEELFQEAKQAGTVLGTTTNPMFNGVIYQRLPDGDYVPKVVYDRVVQAKIPKNLLSSARTVYQYYVDIVYLQPWKTAVAFVCLFLLLLYFIGKLMAAEMGRIMYRQLEAVLVRVPLVRTVYSAAKQVSDFLIARPKITASRVIAVEWPRKGSWALGFVTSEGMRDIRDAANEPILTVLIATSPMPMTGFTVQVRKSETVDLGLTLEEALQFILSCGVVVPRNQALGSPEAGAPEARIPATAMHED